jgi:lysophospholipase L1-like esterase
MAALRTGSMTSRVLASVGALAVALAFAEGWSRHQEGTVVFPRDGRGFATQPGRRGTNSWGMHEREVPPGRDESVHRVVVLGDSMTYGTTTAAETWTRAAEDALGTPWQVLNFAHYGYDAGASAATLREFGAQWAPDVVVFAAYTNDLVPSTLVYLGRSGYPVWVGEGPSVLPESLRSVSAVARRVDGALAVSGVSEQEDPAALRRHLDDMALQADQLGAPLVVVGMLPHVFSGGRCSLREAAPGAARDPEFCALHTGRYARVKRVVQEAGLPWIDGAELWSTASETAWYPENSEDHEHPGPAGHAWFGARVAPELAARVSAMEPN